MDDPVAGWSSQVAREAHNLEVVGSNPAPAIFRALVHRTPRVAQRSRGFFVRRGAASSASSKWAKCRYGLANNFFNRVVAESLHSGGSVTTIQASM